VDNLWIVTGDPQARWTADLGSPGDPERLLAWLAAVLTAGEEHEVYQVREAPAAISDAFCAARLGGEGGRVYGTLPAGADGGAIVARALEID